MLKKTEYKQTIESLTSFLSRAQGIAFALVMRRDGQLFIEERTLQPCWGELRKYKSSHGEECTRPTDRRPGDLSSPFPKGIPEALALKKSVDRSPLDKFIWSDESPWVRGFGGEKNLIVIPGEGVILKDTDIDPTVLVNLLLNTGYRSNTFETFVNKGLTKREALLPTFFAGGYESGQCTGVNTYANSQIVSVRRILNKTPRDLTGGTLKDRYDYNRKDIAQIFRPENSEGVNFGAELDKRVKKITEEKEIMWYDWMTNRNTMKKVKTTKIDMDSVAEEAKKIIQEELQR